MSTNSTRFQHLRFVVPLACQGPFVDYAYACDENYIYERITDRRDGTVVILTGEHPETDAAAFEPWNREPLVGDVVERVEVAS